MRSFMLDARRLPVVRWTVDYGDGSRPSEVILPHSWRQDVDIRFEGPVVYRTQIGVPRGNPHLLFHGVSYEAEVYLDEEPVCVHRGIWDAFTIPLGRWAGRGLEVEVRVRKNGGATFPVRDVLSGFLPYVHHTFGGIHGMVELLHDAPTLELPAPPTRVAVSGGQIYVDGAPFYLRGVLHWGWYPEHGHTNPPEDVMRHEIQEIKRLGFNLVKFCLWVPSHRFLDLLEEEGLFAWVELPLWDPSPEGENLPAMQAEMGRIVRQYRRHRNIIVWTIGCELGKNVPAELRRDLAQTVRNLTGCPLVKDNSGGSEMYEADLREYGDFYDFHPYCDTPFFPPVLDSLLPGPRPILPVLLGEFNDIDAHRDLARLGDELPFWASNLSELNEQGVRWQYDLPTVIDDCRFATQPTRSRHAHLMESSRQKAAFVRKTVQEAVRARGTIGGYVITGLRDTPISSSGLFDDWGSARFGEAEFALWNQSEGLFLIPARRPPWVAGGNRVGYTDPLNHFEGPIHFKLGIHSERGGTFGATWRLLNPGGQTVAAGAEPVRGVGPLESAQIAEIYILHVAAGSYRLVVEAGSAQNEWPIWVVPKLDPVDLANWSVHDPIGVLGNLPVGNGPNLIATRMPTECPEGAVLLLETQEGVQRGPFWRESAYEFRDDGFWSHVPFAEAWSRLLPVSSDAFFTAEGLRALGSVEVLMNRVDTRTYADAAVLVRGDRLLATTLRPFGGLGSQPTSLKRNPAGVALLRDLTQAALR